MDLVYQGGKPLACRITTPAGDRRLVVAARRDPETGETYGVTTHLRPVGPRVEQPDLMRPVPAWHHRPVPPINELTRIEPVHLDRLDHQGIFTTGLLLEVSETPTRRQTLADQVDATTNDVLMWRDEALMLNLASFGPAEHQLLIQARIEGLRQILALDLDAFKARIRAAAGELRVDPPSDLTMEGWWDQARTLEDE